MEPDALLDMLRERYRVERAPDGTYLVSNGGKTVRIYESKAFSQPDVDGLLDRLGPPEGDFGHVGRDDLFPDMRGISVAKTRRRHPRGSLVDPSIFRSPPKHSEEDEDSNPLINIDPITPSRNRKDSFEPDPDHYKPDRSSRFPPH
ncbi:hypothetical protein [Encephalitozoon cuniculi GB-M1]|uniref:Uncharacterized protein n=1 Tax=Encephalitozoon cuniculi (strain GB-M1) TaxID=284813 RepID=Q8SUQ4_ENCCU|nr:uncharacterized protein ECU08_0920 [Encephalitozoon cuniculi GB-M1]CAD26398.1 hypothetical protein [Encephalitozoon cuniculi GB-M1]